MIKNRFHDLLKEFYMKKILLLLASFSLPFVIHTAPPYLPSSRVAFAQIAQPTTTNNATITPQELPCFKAFNGLSHIMYNAPSASNKFIVQAQQPNADPVAVNLSFVSAEQTIVNNAQTTSPTTFSN